MNQNTLNNPSYPGGSADKAARYAEAKAKTEAKRKEIAAKLSLKNEVMREAQTERKIMDSMRAWFEERGISQESFESDVMQEFKNLGIDPNGMTSEEFAIFLEQTSLTVKNEFSDRYTTGYESDNYLNDFIDDIKKLRVLHDKVMSDDGTAWNRNDLEELEPKVNANACNMIKSFKMITRQEHGKYILFPSELPYEEFYTDQGHYDEYLFYAPKIEIGLTEDETKIAVKLEENY